MAYCDYDINTQDCGIYVQCWGVIGHDGICKECRRPNPRLRRAYKRKNGEAYSYRRAMAQLVARAGWRRALKWFRDGWTRKLTA